MNVTDLVYESAAAMQSYTYGAESLSILPIALAPVSDNVVMVIVA